MARRVAVQLGLDTLPAVTVNRFCASSVQTARMAFHAIRAGEGEVFVSAGVECVSRYRGFGARRCRPVGDPEPAVRGRAGAHREVRRVQRHVARPPR